MFVTTTLAALGCAPSATDGSNSPTPTSLASSSPTFTSVPSATVSASALPGASGSSEAPPVVSPEARRADWAARMKLAPPLEVAASLKDDKEKAELGWVRDKYAPVYAKLEQAWVEAPLSCAPTSSACATKWEAAAKTLEELGEENAPGPCERPTGVAQLQRTLAHQAFVNSLLTTLRGQLADAARAQGDATTWQRLTGLAAMPKPCLKCARPEPRSLSDLNGRASPFAVEFAEGSSELPAQPSTLLANLKETLLKTDGPGFIVRGHADPSEPGDKAALGRARAQAMVDWLVKNGVAKTRLVLISYGADLPIHSSASEAGKAANRRVDFERKK